MGRRDFFGPSQFSFKGTFTERENIYLKMQRMEWKAVSLIPCSELYENCTLSFCCM